MKPHKLETKFSKPLADVVLSMEKVDIGKQLSSATQTISRMALFTML